MTPGKGNQNIDPTMPIFLLHFIIIILFATGFILPSLPNIVLALPKI